MTRTSTAEPPSRAAAGETGGPWWAVDRFRWPRPLLLGTIAVACVAWWPTPAAADGDEQLARGAAIFAFSCASCHGASGAGFEEAVAAFPEDHRTCTRCHHPSNAPRMPGSQVGLSTMAFSLGAPPALTDRDRLARYGSAEALFEYVRAAMPRWAPGSLGDQAYRDVTAYLLALADGSRAP